MLENETITENAAAETAAATTNDQPTSNFDVLEGLEKFYQNSYEDGSQADTDPDDAETAAAETADETETETETPAGEPAKTDAPDAADDESDELGESDFDALDPKSEAIEYPDLETLKTKFPRQNKELYAETVKFAELAKEGSDAIESLGGKEMIPALAKMREGIATGEARPVFEGLMEQSNETFLNVVGDAMSMALLVSRDFQTNPDTAEFGKTLEGIADKVIAARFGQETTVAKLQTLADLDRFGLTEKLSRWIEQEYVDSDEWDEFVAANQQPEKFQQLKTQLKEKDVALEQARTKQEKDSAAAAAAQTAEFNKTSGEQIEKALNEIVWKTSVLRDVAADSAELKTEKQFFRARLIADAKAAFTADHATTGALAAQYAAGATGSKSYQDAFTAAVNAAVLNIREQTGVAEKVVAKLYAKTRNGSIAPAAKTAKSVSSVPTQTNEPAAKQPNAEDVQDRLEEFFRKKG